MSVTKARSNPFCFDIVTQSFGWIENSRASPAKQCIGCIEHASQTMCWCLGWVEQSHTSRYEWNPSWDEKTSHAPQARSLKSPSSCAGSLGRGQSWRRSPATAASWRPRWCDAPSRSGTRYGGSWHCLWLGGGRKGVREGEGTVLNWWEKGVRVAGGTVRNSGAVVVRLVVCKTGRRCRCWQSGRWKFKQNMKKS